MKDRFTRVLKGHISIAQAIFPEGTTGGQLDTLARMHLWEVGCDYAHGTGHGVGSAQLRTGENGDALRHIVIARRRRID